MLDLTEAEIRITTRDLTHIVLTQAGEVYAMQYSGEGNRPPQNHWLFVDEVLDVLVLLVNRVHDELDARRWNVDDFVRIAMERRPKITAGEPEKPSEKPAQEPATCPGKTPAKLSQK